MLELTALAAVAVSTMARRHRLQAGGVVEVTWTCDLEDPDGVWLLDVEVLAA